jgi:uncharacterized membrane protein
MAILRFVMVAVNEVKRNNFINYCFGTIKIRNRIYKLCLCHQDPTRSFTVGKHKMPLCSRCTGILVGILLSLLLNKYIHLPLIVSIIFTLPLIVDGFTQILRFRESNNALRFTTGLMFCLAIL